MSYLDVQVLRRFIYKLASTQVVDDPAKIREQFAGGGAPKPDLQDEAMMTVNNPSRVVPMATDAAKAVGQKAMGGVNAAAQYLPDLKTLGYGAGGALLGGAGAMGLANLLRSEEEKKKGPSLLAGAGGALAGGIGLPLLLQYLTGAQSAGPALAANDMSIGSPGAEIPGLQNTRPMDTAGLV
jgi:hypothetical protein